MPAAEVLWNAVTTEGVIETKPETDDDWARLRNAAITLAEATNAVVIPGRHAAPPGTVSAAPQAELTPEKIDALLATQRPAWVAHAHVLHEAAMQAIAAISDVGGSIDAACESCHLQFWYPEQR